jgi:hypothetical protein
MLDGAAIGLSVACLVHCLAFPLIIASLPLVAMAGAPDDHLVHALLLGAAVPLGLFALGRGQARAGPVPLIVGLVGFTMMAIAVFVHHDTPLEAQLTVAGVILVAAAHIANWRARHRFAATAGNRR